jgi:hypothetical protein
MRPRKRLFWDTDHEGVYGLLIADEAQKAKNQTTGIWSILYIQSFPKTVLATATPMFNSAHVSLFS